MSSFQFVHAADIHLDSPLRGLARYEGAPLGEIRGATRRAVENLVELCLEEQARVLVLAGDLYDGDWPDYGTGLFFVEQVARLTREGTRVVWIRGNHDAASRISARLRPPEGAFELATRHPETLRFEELGLAVHGQGYATREVSQDLAAEYPEALPGYFNLGLLHTALDGREGHAPYAPCSVERLRSKGYDYWALGHVHRREIVCRDPWIVFPGNLQGRHARECGPKGATLVRVEDRIVVGVEHRELDVVRWDDLSISASDVDSRDELLERIERTLQHAAESAQDRLLAARVRVTGSSPLHGQMMRERHALEQEIRASALALGAPIWIEKLRLETTPETRVESLPADDPIARLLRAVEAAASDPATLEEIRAALTPLSQRLPAAYRELADSVDFADPTALGELVREIPNELLPRLGELRPRQ